MFQEYALFPHMTVRQNVAFAGRAAGRRAARSGSASRTWPAREPRRLSGGERQRVGLARAIASDPAVLLFDEPLSALDAHTRMQVRAELFDLLRELRLPALLVTHDFEDATALADRVGVIVEGRIHQTGTPAGLLDAPADAFVASFVGSNLMPGVARTLGRGLAEVVLEHGGVIRAVAGPEGAVGAVVHPWDVAVDAGRACRPLPQPDPRPDRLRRAGGQQPARAHRAARGRGARRGRRRARPHRRPGGERDVRARRHTPGAPERRRAPRDLGEGLQRHQVVPRVAGVEAHEHRVVLHAERLGPGLAAGQVRQLPAVVHPHVVRGRIERGREPGDAP